MARLPLPGGHIPKYVAGPNASSMRGHPTAPGPNDPLDLPRHGRQDVLDGQPGIPRLHPAGQGPGTPGTNGSPMQPEPEYDGPTDL